jgi:hypothetical protein
MVSKKGETKKYRMLVYIWWKIGSSKSVYLFRGRLKTRNFERMEEKNESVKVKGKQSWGQLTIHSMKVKVLGCPCDVPLNMKLLQPYDKRTGMFNSADTKAHQ